GGGINRDGVRCLTPGTPRRELPSEGPSIVHLRCRSDDGPLSYSFVSSASAGSCLVAIRWRTPMSYTVYIKQSTTGLVRSRVEADEWVLDRPLWTSGNRACDCARALLFAQAGESVERACGSRAYAIRVTAPDGKELYSEDDF